MNELEKRVLALVDEREIIDFMQALIKAKSDNPPGDTRQAARLCLDKFREYGIEAQLHTPPDSEISIMYPDADNSLAPSVVATISGGAGPTLLMNAHIDTVVAGNLEEWNYEPFGARIEDGYIYGRGAVDDKGAVLAQVMAACYIKRANIPLHGTLQINPVADEEANSTRGTKWLKKAGVLRPDMVIIGEPTENLVACAERLPLQASVTIRGKACHGAMPWNGVNATALMAQFINLVQEVLVPEAEQVKNPYLPLSTISPTKIEGGVQTNIIPDFCRLNFDCRLVPGITIDWLERRMNEILQGMSDAGPAFTWNVALSRGPANWDNMPKKVEGTGIATDPETPLIRSLLSAASTITGAKAEPTGYLQGSDGEIFTDLQVPIAIFGPGDPHEAHSANERISIQQLVEATKILAIMILRLMGPDKEYR